MFSHNPKIFDSSTVLITGGTGSFGGKFARYILENANPKKVIIFSRDEFKQYEMEQRFLDHPSFSKLRFFLGDVRDRDRLNMAFREVDYVVHAAALKQVVAAEYNPFEFIKTNVIGAENIVNAALANGVKKVVALSTDKAANPINFYGTSKLASDKIFVAANSLSGNQDTTFSVVRYGNVMGSRGSVLPLFQRLISEGVKELPITDDRMTRFWITLTQGIEFVISSFEMMHGGELFVPKIPSMKVTDLAKVLAPDLPHKIIGIRPGEKIHETMVTADDARLTLEMDDRFIIMPVYKSKSDFCQNYKDVAKYVPEDFSYSSDNNTWWLNEAELLEMIEEV